MVKPEWGTKQICPKCGTRFYDLEKEPAVCVSCGHSFVPEPILKSKQPLPADEAKPETKDDDDAIALDDEDVDVNDDDVADVSLDDDDADLSDVVDTKLDDDEE